MAVNNLNKSFLHQNFSRWTSLADWKKNRKKNGRNRWTFGLVKFISAVREARVFFDTMWPCLRAPLKPLDTILQWYSRRVSDERLIGLPWCREALDFEWFVRFYCIFSRRVPLSLVVKKRVEEKATRSSTVFYLLNCGLFLLSISQRRVHDPVYIAFIWWFF